MRTGTSPELKHALPRRPQPMGGKRHLEMVALYAIVVLALLIAAATAHAAPAQNRGQDGLKHRIVNVTVWRDIGIYGRDEGRSLNHFVIHLTRGESAALRGVEIGLLGGEIYGSAVGIQIGGAGAVAGGSVLGLQFGGLGAVAGDDLTGIQISGLAAVAGGDSRALQFGGLAAVAGGDAGWFQFGGLAAVAGRNSRAIQVGGLAAVAGEDLFGAQVGTLSAVSGGHVTGFQFGGLASVAAHDLLGGQFGGLAAVNGGDATGVQVGGLASVTGHDLNGIQLSGLANITGGTMRGVQLGFANVAPTQRGLQIGLVNVADELKGLQIGLANTITSDYDGFAFGAVVETPGGPDEREFFVDETGLLTTARVTGTERIRYMFLLGTALNRAPYMWTIGMGMGYHQPLPGGLFLEGDALARKLNEGEFWTDAPHYLLSGRLLAGWQFHERIALIAGPTWNWYSSKVNDGGDFAPEAADAPDSAGDPWTTSWIGWQVGLRFDLEDVEIIHFDD